MALRILNVFFILFCFAGNVLSADNEKKEQVLILHSYSYDYPWTQFIQKGIEDTFQQSGKSVTMHVEYMEANRVYDNAYLQKMLDTYRHKFRNRIYDLIICSDNNAFDFLRAHRDKLFPGTPVVFCGVNGYRDSMLRDVKLFTGVAENVDVDENIRLIQRLHPKTRNIVLYGHSESLAYLGIKDLFQQAFADNAYPVRLVIKEVITIRQVIDDLRTLPPGSVIFLISYFKNEKGDWIPYEQSTKIISLESSHPLYGVIDANLGYGVIGGYIVTGIGQGNAAASLALRIMDGENINNIPVLNKSPNRFMFDYKQLARFKINLSDLPEESLIINKPDSFYDRYKNIILSVTGTIGVLVLIISVLLINILRRKKAENALRQSEEQYRSLVDNVNIGVFRTTTGFHGRFIKANPAMIKIFGYDSPEEFIGISVIDLYQTSEDRKVFLAELQQNGFVKNRELRLRKKDGTPIWCSSTATLQYDEHGSIIWMDGVLEDITERKLGEEKLYKTTEELRALTSKMMIVGERERKRIAQDLHDSIGQYLTAIKYNSENILSRITANQSDYEIVDSIKRGIPLIRHTIEEVRRIMMDLRPTILDDLGVLPTISWFCEEFQKVYSVIRIEEEIHLEENDIPDNLKIIIFRIIQEAVNNSVKHSSADHIRIILRNREGIELSILDNGIGFNPQRIQKGLGLVSMRERTESCGGTLSVKSSDNCGTVISAFWPGQINR